MKLRNPFRRRKSKESSAESTPESTGPSNSDMQEALGQSPSPKTDASVLELAAAAGPPAKASKPKKQSWLSRRKKKNDGVKANKLLKGRDVKFMQSLGGGSKNEVYKAQYKKEIGSSGTKEGFWKASQGNESAKAMASSRLDQALGTNMLSQDVEAKHNGQLGITSPKVAGKAMSSNVYGPDIAQQYIDAYRDAGVEGYGGVVDALKEEGRGGMFKFDDEAGSIQPLVGTQALDVDLKNPEVQRGMSNLGVLDYLTGQEDRHEGNVFVDPSTGQVSGIDNDMSFGADMTAEKFEAMGENDKNIKVQGLPKQIDAELGMRIVGMDESEFLKILEGNKKDQTHLTDEEMEAALDRFRHLKAYVDELYMNDGFIWKWDESTYDEAVASGKGYLARAAQDRQAADVNLAPRTGAVA